MDDDAANGRHSLAHELAVALMPEPSAGSKLLAEEFGIEYDEGAEGIDELDATNTTTISTTTTTDIDAIPIPANESHSSGGMSPGGLSININSSSSSSHSPFHADVEPLVDDADAAARPSPEEYDPVFASPPLSRNRQTKKERPEKDAMEVLSQDLESTDKFLGHLRRLDADSSTTTTTTSVQSPPLERIASDIIRRLNETARDREGQVRELLECEREFRKIAGELGGGDVLGQLDELDHVTVDDSSLPEAQTNLAKQLDAVIEEDPSSSSITQLANSSLVNDWELDPDQQRLGDDDEDDGFDSDAPMSPLKLSFPPPPPINGPPTPAKTIPQLADLRSFTTSLVASLTTISEQAQVNGAATTEAGRKIRALKNKLGGWRTDWDSAERSRVRIEKWEAGIVEVDGEAESVPAPLSPDAAPLSPTRTTRVDGRMIVSEHLRAFELALADAAIKTQAIMAAS